MKALILFIALVLFAGCGHMHPVAQHEHLHDHHKHEPEAVTIHKELIGEYELDFFDDGKNREGKWAVKGKLAITRDHNIHITVMERSVESIIKNPELTGWSGWNRFSGGYYGYDKRDKPIFYPYGILPELSVIVMGRQLLEYQWDGIALTLTRRHLNEGKWVKITMKWRKLR